MQCDDNKSLGQSLSLRNQSDSCETIVHSLRDLIFENMLLPQPHNLSIIVQQFTGSA